MILRRVDRLRPGMKIRLKLPQDKRHNPRIVARVSQAVDPERVSVFFHPIGSEDRESGINLFPDDMVEFFL